MELKFISIIIYYSFIVIYLIGVTIFYWIDDLKFSLYLNKLRKTFYLLATIGMVICVLKGWINFNKWQYIVCYAASIIVIDISIFETPSITKFANAEFKSNEIISKITSKNERTFDIIENKQVLFLSIIQEVNECFDHKDLSETKSFEKYKDELLKYLSKYTNLFKISVFIHEWKYSDNIENNIFILSSLIRTILIANNLKMRQNKLEKLCKGIISGQAQELGNSTHLIPIYGKSHSFIVEISGQNIIGTDIMNLLYMINLFEIQTANDKYLKSDYINDKINI